jgi:high-affinity Fe2+/Pb2+ permease
MKISKLISLALIIIAGVFTNTFIPDCLRYVCGYVFGTIVSLVICLCDN